MAVPLIEFLVKFKADAAGLERRVKGATFLVFHPPRDDDEDENSDYRFRTVSGVARPLSDPGEPVIFEVKKQKDNAFRRGVTVGRTANNDLVFDDASVSRFHAWFQEEEQGWSVADAGSKNGTTLDGKKLSSKKPAAIVPGARVRFGSVEVVFLDGASFLRMIKERARV